MIRKTSYKVGELIRISTSEEWTLGYRRISDPWLRECPMPSSRHYGPSFEKHYNLLHGEVGLVVEVIKNRLDQPMGFRIQIGQEIWLCKSVVAEKYFEAVEVQGNVASRGSGQVQGL